MLLFQQLLLPVGEEGVDTPMTTAKTLSNNAPNKNGDRLNASKTSSLNLKGVIGMCHGFGDHTSDLLMDAAARFCREGFVVLMMDVEVIGI